MSRSGGTFDPCHHYVHFTYDSSYDGHIVSADVTSIDAVSFPKLWGSPSDGQANAGYHNWGHGECDSDSNHSPSDFSLMLTVDKSPFDN